MTQKVLNFSMLLKTTWIKQEINSVRKIEIWFSQLFDAVYIAMSNEEEKTEEGKQFM